MPYPFVLSTTSHLNFSSSLSSSTHPSLPSAATSQRALLRSALKTHKRLSPTDQANNFGSLVTILYGYLKYLISLDLALGGKSISGEDVDIALANEIEVAWRPTLSSTSIPGRESERVQGRGLDFEIYFAHHTLALVQHLVARQALLGLYSTTNPSAEQRLALIQNATKSLKTAHSLHSYLCSRSNFSSDGPPSFPPTAVDISSPMQSALQHLTHAELNLLGVLKDDPYPAVLIQSRNKDDKEWMIKAPEIPKVRAQVLRRLCIGAAEHAASASASLKVEGRKVSKELLEYCEDVRKTARAKACRFAALDSDMAGETGKAIAWLRAGMNELGIEVSKDGAKAGGLSRLKASWNERREDKRIEKGSMSWGADGGRLEEGRILEHLDRKFTKENNTINIQIVPEWKPLLATMPSGMNMPLEEKWRPQVLEEDELAGMRGPPDEGNIEVGISSDEEDDTARRKQPVGAFPGTQEDYAGGGTNYY